MLVISIASTVPSTDPERLSFVTRSPIPGSRDASRESCPHRTLEVIQREHQARLKRCEAAGEHDRLRAAAHIGYKSAEFDTLVRQADADPNPENRDKTYQQASRMLSNDAAAAWWCYSATKYLKKPWLKGISDTVIDAD